MDAFARAFLIVSMGRKFAMSENGFICWVPRETRAGDVVAVMPGGKVPYILRQRSESEKPYNSAHNDDDTHRYRFLGDAYIHGIMYEKPMTRRNCGRSS